MGRGRRPGAARGGRRLRRGPLRCGGDADALTGLFAPHPVDLREERLAFTGPSPRDWLQAQLDHHPVWLEAAEALRERGAWDDVVARSLALFEAANEDPAAFRVTGRYLVATVQRGEAA